MEPRGTPWDPVGPRGTPWDPVGPRGTPWDPVGPRGTRPALQFRTRDCKGLDVSLLCASRPIIESSSPVRFGCFDMHYEGLEQQLASLSFTPLRNFWRARMQLCAYKLNN